MYGPQVLDYEVATGAVTVLKQQEVHTSHRRRHDTIQCQPVCQPLTTKPYQYLKSITHSQQPTNLVDQYPRCPTTPASLINNLTITPLSTPLPPPQVPNYDSSLYESRRIHCTARDGTQVPPPCYHLPLPYFHVLHGATPNPNPPVITLV